MEDILLLNTIERYLEGKMLPDENAFFEELRRNTPEIDQMVVEHKLFLHQMDNYSGIRNLKNSLHEAHLALSVSGAISDNEKDASVKVKVVQFWHRYKKVTAIAASIAGITALFISGLVSYFSPAINPDQLQNLSKQIDQVRKNQQVQGAKLKEVDSKIPKNSILTSGGTAFMIDPKGYLVTNAHVLKGSGAVVVNQNGQEFNARIITIDIAKDLAILKIQDEDFIPAATLPYSIKRTALDLGEDLFTLGYPRDEIVYNMGYLSAESGYDGDTSSCQISLSANPGNSGGPVFNKNGEIVAIISSKQAQSEGVVFAIKAKNIFTMIDELKETDTSVQKIKMAANLNMKGYSRVDQIKKAEDCVYLVKAYNKK